MDQLWVNTGGVLSGGHTSYHVPVHAATVQASKHSHKQLHNAHAYMCLTCVLVCTVYYQARERWRCTKIRILIRICPEKTLSLSDIHDSSRRDVLVFSVTCCRTEGEAVAPNASLLSMVEADSWSGEWPTDHGDYCTFRPASRGPGCWRGHCSCMFHDRRPWLARSLASSWRVMSSRLLVHSYCASPKCTGHCERCGGLDAALYSRVDPRRSALSGGHGPLVIGGCE